ncbi:MAG: hypothetical protein M3T49_08925, partial [Candidatus Eremiobacteraeota bacterium]|nr:hypothetical protein [Candidatus Eremiobacteraeota bacterium]
MKVRYAVAVCCAGVCLGAALSPAWAADPKVAPPFARLKWREIGPAVSGGRIAAVTGVPDDPNLYYIGSAGGGVWKSVNGGASWQAVFEHEPVASIGAIAIDPRNHDVVWVGTGETNPRNDIEYGDGIYRTTDGGKTWTNMGLRDTMQISRIAIDPRNPNVIVVGAMGNFFKDSPARGIYRTTDGGKTWSKTLYVGPSSGVADLAADPNNPDILFAGVWQFRRQPWTFTSGGPQDGLYRSADGGRHWTRLRGRGLPAGIMGRIGLAIAPSDSKRIYAIIESRSGILWRSDDAGASWSLVSKDTLVDQRPFYFTHINVDPKNRDHVYAVSEMLAESKDGGRKFKEIAKDVHVDYHAMWISPKDPNRMMTGQDGGYALSLDGGKTWSFSRNLAIGQVYHVGINDRVPYDVCAPLQDNNGFCGPSNSLNDEGIPDEAWTRVIGGDGMWAVPDPSDPDAVWTDLQDGRVSIFDRKTQRNTFIMPDYEASALDFDLYRRKYRFNWDSPIAFSLQDPKTAWYGGNVVFQTTDRGVHWIPISPDLTLNLKEHQQPSGGPLALDVSGAETSDTILDIEGSQLAKGEIWVGTDDGVVQLTRDGGGQWTNVTPAGVPPYARVETVAPSTLQAGTAFAAFDRHRSGDRAPYLFATNDFGKTWRSIVANLPRDQYVRTVRPDIRNPHLLYAGLEQGIWASYDDGAHWRSLQLNLPTVSVRDIRMQPTFDDLVIATHGRAVWILDDVRPVQDMPAAQAAGTMLFPPRTAYEFSYHANDEGLYTRYAGHNPPDGAIVNFYQASPQAAAPVVDILDSRGIVVRTISGTHKVADKDVPNVTNDAGVNRVVWDFKENGPVQWMGALREEYRGPKTGPTVVPGTYSARIVLAGRTFTQPLEVKADPRASLTQADYQSAHDFSEKYFTELSRIDAALNTLDAVQKGLTKALSASAKRNPELRGELEAVQAKRQAVFSQLTANYANDEDSIQRPGALRDDLEGLLRGGSPPLPALLQYAASIDERYDAAMRAYDAFRQTDVPRANDALRKAGLS